MGDFAALGDEAIFGHPRRKAALSSLLLASALLLAGCETSGILTRPGKGVAEVANQSADEAATGA